MSKKIYFRADAGAGIGYGHFIRSLALADMLKSDFECVMFTQSPTPYQVEEAEKVCQLVALPADESRFDQFLTYLTGNEIVVLDNYFYTTEYQQQIKDVGCKLVCIDEIHNRHFVADVVICPDPCVNTSFSLAPYTRYYGGIEWSLLRKVFIENQNTYHHCGSNSILVAFGGADPMGLTQKIVGMLLKNSDWQVHAVVGDKVCLNIIDARLIVHNRISAEQLSHLFQTVRLSILSASTVCMEALCVGCPVVAGYYVNNQVEYYQSLVAQSLIKPVGNLLELDINTLVKAIAHVTYNSTPISIDFKYQRNRIINMFKLL